MAIRLNHKTQLFRLIHRGETIARVEEVELVETEKGLMFRGFNYLRDAEGSVFRTQEAEIPA
jgi:hypothetical protein